MWSCDEYKNWLLNRLTEIKQDLDFDKYSIEVFNEQDYAKEKSIKPKTITVILKFLQSFMVIAASTQPIQMLVVSEENSLSVANTIITKFCHTYNLTTIPDGTTYVKHSYSTPVVLSNFNLIGVGLRSVLYINTTLYILEDVLDINTLKIDDNEVVFLSATAGYTMNGDTQPFDGGYAITEKDFATFSMTIIVPCVKTDFTTKCLQIMNGTSTYKGNDVFAFDFSIGDLSFALNMKLKSCTFTTAKNNVPSLQLGFSV